MFTLTKVTKKQYKESFKVSQSVSWHKMRGEEWLTEKSSETVASVVENQPVYSIDLEHGESNNQKGF